MLPGTGGGCGSSGAGAGGGGASSWQDSSGGGNGGAAGRGESGERQPGLAGLQDNSLGISSDKPEAGSGGGLVASEEDE